MPRCARLKSNNSIMHVMVRSIKEINLFNDDRDKIKYFSIIKKCQIKYGFTIYAFCLMNNHGHLLVDCSGSDISKVMHSINLSYAIYYNRKYDRYGHVFQDRFKSKLVQDQRYLITLSAYIHNNPKDILGYEGCVEKYPFSSLRDYLNKSDSFDILDKKPLSYLLFLHNKGSLRKYLNFVTRASNEVDVSNVEFINQKALYQSHKALLPKSTDIKKVISKVTRVVNSYPQVIYLKYRRLASKTRALSCLFLSMFCGLSQAEICEVLGNITQSRVSQLTSMALDIIEKEPYLISEFLK